MQIQEKKLPYWDFYDNVWQRFWLGLVREEKKQSLFEHGLSRSLFFGFNFLITKPNQKGFGDPVNIHKTLRKHSNPY